MATNQVNADLDFQNTHQGTNVPTPTLDGHLANKSYVDNLVHGLAYKNEVATATTANITLSGEQTLDLVLTSVSRVLVKNQTDAKENGLYLSASGAWARTTDANTTAELNNATVFVTGAVGSANAGKEFTQVTKNPVIATDNIVWTEVQNSVYVAGDGMTESPTNTFNVVTADASLTVTANDIKVNPGTAANTSLETAGGSLRLASAGLGSHLTGGSGSAVNVSESTISRWKTQITHSSGLTVTYTHNLGKANFDYAVTVFGTSNHAVPGLELTGLANVVKAANSVTVTFGISQGANTIGISVLG